MESQNPETLQTDNGPPFNSHAFAEFAKESGFQHKTSHRSPRSHLRYATGIPQHTTPCHEDDTISTTDEPGCKDTTRSFSN